MAIKVSDGALVKFGGPPVPGINWVDAQNWCHENAGHLVVVGELIEEALCFAEGDLVINHQNLN